MGRKDAKQQGEPALDWVSKGGHRDAAILKLGRILVRQLGLVRETDTLARWMAHHIAELIHDAETAQGDSAIGARLACQDAIIALWAHRAGLPGRAPHSELLDGWTKLLRSQNASQFFPTIRSSQTTGQVQRSETETYLQLALKLRTMVDPLIRAALHLAVQAADPAEVEKVSTIAEAQLEDEETKVTRILIGWSEKRLPESNEMKAEVRKVVEDIVKGAEDILDSLERLATKEELSGSGNDDEATTSLSKL
ncbi:hypothetical protein [Cypionkella aquatica]|nr:hypothetical protein [Cypionkella aquatica]